MNVRYRVDLSQIERAALRALLSGGKHASRRLKRAQILLAADAGASDEEQERRRGRLDRVPDQATLRGRQSGAGAERRTASRSGAQTYGQGRSLAGGDSLCQPARRLRPLDA